MSIIDKYKTYFPTIVKLLGSGMLTSLGFVLLSSGKVDYISSEISVKILLFIQFQLIGITIAKYGLDSLVFAKMMEAPNKIYDPVDYIRKKGVVLSFLCAVAYAVMYDYTFAVVIFFTIILDVYSVVSLVQMNVLKHYSYAFFTSIMAYPLFFSILFVSSVFYEFSYWQMVILYGFCIFMRFLFSFIFINREKNRAEVEILKLEVPFSLGIQQVLNFNLFKLDQIIVSMGAVVTVFLGLTMVDVRQVLFLSRFPELVSGVLVSLSVLYAPYLIIESREGFTNILTKYGWLFLLYTMGLFAVLMGYLLLWNGETELDKVYIFSYFLVSVLVVFVNMTTLGYLRKSNVANLVRNLLVSSGLGIGVLFVIAMIGLGKYAISVVPFQMLCFLIIRLRGR